MKKYLVLPVFLFTAFFAFADLQGYEIRDYKFSGTLHENNVLSVNEEITVDFLEPRHGIYRTIPEFMYARRFNGNDYEVYEYRNSFRKIKTGKDKVKKSHENANLVLQLGDKNRKISGLHTYTISYDYVISDDRNTYGDFFYHSVLGSAWETTIDSFTFEIFFEKPVVSGTDFIITSGDYASNSNLLNVKTTFRNNCLSGSARNIKPNEAITVFAELPEGYFKGAKKTSHVPSWIAFCLTALLSIYFIIKSLTSEKKRPVQTVEFYPPAGIRPSEVGKIIDNSSDDIDLLSLIPLWAKEGLIKIEEQASGKVVKNEYLILTKLKDIPEKAPAHEKKFFKLLFKDGNERELRDLKESFLTEFEEAKKILDKSFKDKKALYKHEDLPFWATMITGLLCAATMALNSPVYHLDYLYIGIIMIAPGFISFKDIFLSYKKHFKKTSFVVKRIISVIIYAVCALFYIIMTEDQLSIISPWWITGLMALTELCFFMCPGLSVPTDFNIEATGKLMGLKNFIQTAELPKLKVLVDEDPSYFYNVLPYAFVFGLSDKWAKQFKNITLSKPSWYSSTYYDSYSCYRFSRSLSKGISAPISQLRQEVAKSHASSGGSSFSGGGGGGGGGGSW